MAFNASEINEGLNPNASNVPVLFYIVVITIALALFAAGIYQIKNVFNKKTYDKKLGQIIKGRLKIVFLPLLVVPLIIILRLIIDW